MRDWIINTLGGGATALAIVVAIIGLAGALGGALTSYLVAQKAVYINAITSERMKWITSLKNNLASMVSILHSVEARINGSIKADTDELMNDYKKLNEISCLLELQLNPTGGLENNIMVILEATQKRLSKSGIPEASILIKGLRAHARWMFKIEWHQVKIEASGLLYATYLKFKKSDLEHAYKTFSNRDESLILARRICDKASPVLEQDQQ